MALSEKYSASSYNHPKDALFQFRSAEIEVCDSIPIAICLSKSKVDLNVYGYFLFYLKGQFSLTLKHGKTLDQGSFAF